MGFLKNLFGGEKAEQPKAKINWIPLNDMNQLDLIVDNSNNKYQAIFKHSTRCGISSGVLRQFERQEETDEIDFYYLDLLSYRSISNEIASRFGIIHQSPQLVVLKNKDVVAHASHYDIMNIELD